MLKKSPPVCVLLCVVSLFTSGCLQSRSSQIAQQEIENLQADLAESNAQRQMLSATVAELELKLAASQKPVENLAEQLANVTDQYLKSERRQARLEEENKLLRDELAEAKRQ